METKERCVTPCNIRVKAHIHIIFNEFKWKNDIKIVFGSNKRAWTWVTTMIQKWWQRQTRSEK